MQETSELAALFAGRRRILSAAPCHHIYGFLFTVLLPQALGLAEEDVVDLRGSTPGWLARGARAGDLVIGHPDFWRAVAATVPRMPDDVFGVTSTAPCPDSISAAVEGTGLAHLFHIYGSSETAGIGWRASHRDPYRLFPHWRFGDEGAASLLRQMPGGSEMAFASTDHLHALTPTSFHVGPRLDDAVQVGGTNVFPSKVAALLRGHPLVAQVAVRLMRLDEGSRLKAYVVPASSVEDLALFHTQLQSWIETKLAVAERPRSIRFGTSLPVSATGKMSDWNMDPDEPERPGDS